MYISKSIFKTKTLIIKLVEFANSVDLEKGGSFRSQCLPLVSRIFDIT